MSDLAHEYADQALVYTAAAEAAHDLGVSEQAITDLRGQAACLREQAQRHGGHAEPRDVPVTEWADVAADYLASIDHDPADVAAFTRALTTNAPTRRR